MTIFEDIPIDVLFPQHIISTFSLRDFYNLRCVSKNINDVLKIHESAKLQAEWDSICSIDGIAGTYSDNLDMKAIIALYKADQKDADYDDASFFDGSLIINVTSNTKESHDCLMRLAKLAHIFNKKIGIIYLVFEYINRLITVANTEVFNVGFRTIIYAKAEDLRKKIDKEAKKRTIENSERLKQHIIETVGRLKSCES